jgi:hypothetical protein
VTLQLPSGKRLHNYGKSPLFIGKTHYKWPFSIAFCMFTRGYFFQTSKNPQLAPPPLEPPAFSLPKDGLFGEAKGCAVPIEKEAPIYGKVHGKNMGMDQYLLIPFLGG